MWLLIYWRVDFLLVFIETEVTTSPRVHWLWRPPIFLIFNSLKTCQAKLTTKQNISLLKGKKFLKILVWCRNDDFYSKLYGELQPKEVKLDQIFDVLAIYFSIFLWNQRLFSWNNNDRWNEWSTDQWMLLLLMGPKHFLQSAYFHQLKSLNDRILQLFTTQSRWNTRRKILNSFPYQAGRF